MKPSEGHLQIQMNFQRGVFFSTKILYNECNVGRNSIVTGIQSEHRGIVVRNPAWGKKYFYTSKRPDHGWDPNSFLFTGQVEGGGSFLWTKATRE